MKSFSNFLKESVSESKLSQRVEITKNARNFKAEFNVPVPAHFIVGAVSFGTISFHRTMIIDKNHKDDKKLARSEYVARIQNSMTKFSGGFVENATLAKFNLEKGTMWLAEDDADDGSITWGKGFKFKHMNLNGEVAVAIKWIDAYNDYKGFHEDDLK